MRSPSSKEDAVAAAALQRAAAERPLADARARQDLLGKLAAHKGRSDVPNAAVLGSWSVDQLAALYEQIAGADRARAAGAAAPASSSSSSSSSSSASGAGAGAGGGEGGGAGGGVGGEAGAGAGASARPRRR